MLSRVADSMYWLSRYLERAEHTARLLDVNLNQMLDQTPLLAERRWDRLLASLGAGVSPNIPGTAYAITESLTFAQNNPASIMSCIGAARENARQIREQISSEMWEQLNRLYLHVRNTNMDELWNAEPHEFFQHVKDGAHLFQGITDATLSHGEGWQFIQVGRFIERTTLTSSLLDAHVSDLTTASYETGATDYFEWVGLLKSCTAFEAYCKVYTATVQPQDVVEFLLLNADFPRSVRFCTAMGQAALKSLSGYTGSRSAARIDRLAGRLRASLDYGQVDEIMNDSLHDYLDSIQHQCTHIHTAVYQTYIAYPIESALTQAAMISSQ